MEYPSQKLERELWRAGYQNIVGIDEVGRGAWAGPIVACATVISKFESFGFAQDKLRNSNLSIRDSKLLSEKQREKIFNQLSKKVIWSVGLVSHKEIDSLGITRANLLVIKRALRGLTVKPDYLLVDRVNGFKHRLPFKSIVGGDRKVFSIALASILAKVYRDRLMRGYHHKYPAYHFHQHKGYGTKLHLDCLKKNGICRIHRQSYQPVKNLL
ncbi:MAG TPA: ribonuclease HII [Patescibacteria group bacterium]|nr:ribonuclease HII [Patescibacteria group bacterium]